MPIRYRIAEKIGAGAMGVVFRAEDVSLRRSVALKVLPGKSLLDPGAHTRLLQEARIAATLSHPNICTIYMVDTVRGDEVEDSTGSGTILPGTTYIAMEMIEGKNLATVMRESGPLSIKPLLNVAIQIAEGLAAAHSMRIIHRDLSPRNIMVTAGGHVKILDFGLAKRLTTSATANGSITTETMALTLTTPGVIVGTVGYMSPEQAQGHKLDARSDIFALGTILYEMATGHRPFQGDTPAATIAKLREVEPESLGGIRADLPIQLVRIIHRCLKKKPEERYNDTRDLVEALKDLREEVISSGVIRTSGARSAGVLGSARDRLFRPRLILGATLAIAFAVGGILVSRLAWRPPPPKPSYSQVTFSGSIESFALSPDGAFMAYVDRPKGTLARLRLKDLLGGAERTLLEARSVASIHWSSDGTQLLCLRSNSANTSCCLVPRIGGPPRTLGPVGWTWVSWVSGNQQIAGLKFQDPRPRIQFFDIETGDTSSVTMKGDHTFKWQVECSPRAKLLLVFSGDAKDRRFITTLTCDGRTQTNVAESICEIASPQFAPSGDKIWFLLGGEGPAVDLMRIAIDPISGIPRRRPRAVLSGLQTTEAVDIARDGRALFSVQRAGGQNLWLTNLAERGDGDTLRIQRLTSGTYQYGRGVLSPDGTMVVYQRSDGATEHTFVMSLADGATTQITYGELSAFNPAWSPDGNQIAFSSLGQDSVFRVCTIPAAGGRIRVYSRTRVAPDALIQWAPGQNILYHPLHVNNQMILDPITEELTPVISPPDSLGRTWPACYTGDGRYVVSRWMPSDSTREMPGIWLFAVDHTSRQRISSGAGAPIGGSADGEFVFIRGGGYMIMKVRIATGMVEHVSYLPAYGRTLYITMLPSKEQAVLQIDESQTDIWRIGNLELLR